MGTILLFGFDSLPEVLAVRAAAGPFLAEVKPVWREDYNRPIGCFAGRKTRSGPAAGFAGTLGGRMLVLCDLDDQLDALLPALRQAGIGPECYKAVLTVHNQDWDAVTLFAELRKERRAMERHRGG